MKTIVALVDLSDLTFKVLKEAHALATAFNSEDDPPASASPAISCMTIVHQHERQQHLTSI